MASIRFPFSKTQRTTAIAFFVCAGVLANSIPIARASQTDLEKAASHIAARIAKRGRTRVIVADFLGPKDQVNELGRQLADEFCAALAKANPDLSVLPRTGRTVTIETQFGESAERRESRAAQALAEAAGAEVVVAGTMQRRSDWIDLRLRTWDIPAQSGKGPHILEANKLDELSARTSLSKEKEVLLGRLLTPAETHEFRLTASSGRAARRNPSVPQCLDCPDPPRMKPALVILRITVSAEGRVTAAEIVKAADPKTTEVVVQTVRKWRFLPATDSDGQPIESRTEVQINLRRDPL